VVGPRLDQHPRPPPRRRRWEQRDGAGGQDEQALGRGRGGFGTKVLAAVNGPGPPVKLVLTPGQAADVTQAKTLSEGVPFAVVIAGRGHDSQVAVEATEAKGGEVVIPTQKDLKVQREIDRERYKGPQPGGAVLGARQAAPARGHPLREDGPKLPGPGSGDIHQDPVAVAQTDGVTKPLSTRPSP